MHIERFVYWMFQPVLRGLRRNRWLIRRIFGVKIPGGMAVQFDPTTVLLAYALREIAEREDGRVLELGIGQGALVSLSLAFRHGVELEGIDCSPQRVDSSRRVAAYNGISGKFWLSDLFAQVPAENKYDLVFFNPPYVPTRLGRALRFTQRLSVDSDRVWDGGEDGTAVLREFLYQAERFLSSRGRVVFGVQGWFVPDGKVLDIVAASGLVLKRRVVRRFFPSVVYILEKGTKDGSNLRVSRSVVTAVCVKDLDDVRIAQCFRNQSH